MPFLNTESELARVRASRSFAKLRSCCVSVQQNGAPFNGIPMLIGLLEVVANDYGVPFPLEVHQGVDGQGLTVLSIKGTKEQISAVAHFIQSAYELEAPLYEQAENNGTEVLLYPSYSFYETEYVEDDEDVE